MDPGFFQELKRRKVYRVAIAYIVAAWALAQGVSQVLPVFEISNSAIRVVIALLLIGFPVALVLAWLFDITPQGIQRTSRVAPQTMPLPQRRRNLILLTVVGAIIAAAAGFFVLPRAVARKIDKSIAVLPFENLSDDKANAYFADGIQDDILTNLSKIGDLKVISRTSVMPYRGTQKNVRDIGKALGVSKVLEGSVRRSGNQVRVNVQLIDATSNQHLWAEDYDGDLTDVFKIQSDLAGKIANALEAKLSPSDKARMARRPTKNTDAYAAFTKAHNLQSFVEDLSRLQQAEKAYEEALQLDPDFAEAAARYSQLESWIYKSFDPTPPRRERALQLAERALQLDPNLPEGHLARGFLYYYGDRNYAAALNEFALAQQGLPNDSDAYLAIGAIQRRQGKWKESTANLEKAAELNPQDTWPLQNLAFNYEMMRNGDAAIATVERALQINPNSLELLGLKVQFLIEQRGDFKAANEVVERVRALIGSGPPSGKAPRTLRDPQHFDVEYASVLILERRFDEGLRAMMQIEDRTLNDRPESLWNKYGYEGICRLYLHDEPGARAALLKEKDLVVAAVAQTPDFAQRRAQLALTLAWLGEKDAAIAEGQRAVQLLPESVDAFEGPGITEQLAKVYALNGDADHAIDLIEGLLNRPSALTVHTLKVEVFWDKIRDHPRFKALIDKYSAKT